MKGKENRSKYPLLIQLWGLWERRELASGVRGGARAENQGRI